MIPSFPRPCRYADLTRANQEGLLSKVALLTDGPPENLYTAISAWRSIIPSAHLRLFFTPEYAPFVSAIEDQSIIAEEVAGFCNLTDQPNSTEYKVWASCAPYDAYGVLVKAEVESVIAQVIKQNNGIYLAQDPAYGVVRWFDAFGLRDRLRIRPIRIRLYRIVCYLVHSIAYAASRFAKTDFLWRRL